MTEDHFEQLTLGHAAPVGGTLLPYLIADVAELEMSFVCDF